MDNLHKKSIITDLSSPMPEDENQNMPIGVLQLDPYKDVRLFEPQQEPQKYGWADAYEQQYIIPLGNSVANVFGVSLLNDTLYSGGSEAEKKSLLSVVCTRSNMMQIKPGIWGWFPIVVVAAKRLIVMIEFHVDLSNNKHVWPKALLWSNITKRYEIVIDPKAGRLKDPFVLPKYILPKYISIEKI